MSADWSRQVLQDENSSEVIVTFCEQIENRNIVYI